MTTTLWLRSARFDLTLQLGALAGVAPPLVLHAALGAERAAALLPLAALIAVPFLHVFGSFFVGFSRTRNLSASPPRQLAWIWAAWIVAAIALQAAAPRALATFALLYGGWHILRQNFGFLRELAGRAGLGKDRALRRLDLAACAAPAAALWLLVVDRGPWRFIGAEIHHLPVPGWLVAAGFASVPLTALARELYLGRRGRGSNAAARLLLAGNAAALLGPALLLADLTLIYILSASYHGIQYLVYIAERERERFPDAPPAFVLLPLVSAIGYSMLAWSGALTVLALLSSTALADRALASAWYAIVPFHYFLDSRIWRRRAVAR